MEDIRSLGRDVKKFSEELDKFEQYLEKDTEPPECKETIENFRSVVKGTLSSLTTEYSNIKSQVDAASSTSEKFRKLLSSMESLVEKREVQLSKYGFKPTKQELPPYPGLNSFKISRPEEGVAKKMGTILQKIPHFTPCSKVSACSSTTVGEALIAKYTPAKRKFTENHAPESASSVQSARLSRYGGDRGENTYVISSPSKDIKEGQISDTTRAKKTTFDVEDRFAKYLNKKEMTTEEKASTIESSQGLAKRMERYSIMPKQDYSPFVIPSQPLEEVKQVKDVGRLLSKYDVRPSKTTSTSVKNPAVKKAESVSPSPAPFTPPAVVQRNALSSQEDSFIGVVPNNPQQSLAFQDEDLERTVNVPYLFKKSAKPTNFLSTPEMKENRVEVKTPVCNKYGGASPNLGSVSTDLFTKSESKLPGLKPTPINENKDEVNSSDSNNVNNENVDSNYGAASEVTSVSAVSSIVSKYSKKYN